eukprot:gene8534-biopygen7157
MISILDLTLRAPLPRRAPLDHDAPLVELLVSEQPHPRARRKQRHVESDAVRVLSEADLRRGEVARGALQHVNRASYC